MIRANMVVNMEMRPCQRDSIDGDLERCRHPFIGAGAEGTNLVLTGQVPLILMVSATLAFPISFALIRLYRRAVLKTMTPTRLGPRFSASAARDNSTVAYPMHPPASSTNILNNNASLGSSV